MDKAMKNTLVAMATTALGVAGAGCGDEGESPEAAPAAEATTGGEAHEASCGAGSCGGEMKGEETGGAAMGAEEAPEASCGEGSCG